MDVYQTCIICNQRIHIAYKDGDISQPFVFIDHTFSDNKTHCSGSKQQVGNQKIIELITSIDPMAKPASQALPKSSSVYEDKSSSSLQPATVQPSVSNVNPPKKERCPKCKKEIDTKINLRGSLVFIEHPDTRGQRCGQSFRPIPNPK